MEKIDWFYIRKAISGDADEILTLIGELAKFENFNNMPRITRDTLASDIEKGHALCYVAVLQQPSSCDLSLELGSVIGYLCYYYSYSTFEGRSMFIEDIFVKESCRHRGIGTHLWGIAAGVAKREKLARIEFSVLDWNQSAIDFYLKTGSKDLTTGEGWHLYRLEPKQFDKLALPVPGPL